MKVNPVIGSVIKRRPGTGLIPAWAIALALRIRKMKEAER